MSRSGSDSAALAMPAVYASFALACSPDLNAALPSFLPSLRARRSLVRAFAAALSGSALARSSAAVVAVSSSPSLVHSCPSLERALA